MTKLLAGFTAVLVGTALASAADATARRPASAKKAAVAANANANANDRLIVQWLDPAGRPAARAEGKVGQPVDLTASWASDSQKVSFLVERDTQGLLLVVRAQVGEGDRLIHQVPVVNGSDVDLSSVAGLPPAFAKGTLRAYFGAPAGFRTTPAR